jgi:hypothetical protein
MLTYDLPQGSEEWKRLRLGKPTTSRFGEIITPTGKKASALKNYANELLSELHFGCSEPFVETFPMKRGKELEPLAVQVYEAIKGTKTKEIGFCTSDDGRVGCSPDRLVFDDGLLEVKCPMDKQHWKNIRAFLGKGVMDMKYYPQVQGQMLLTGRKWCDWMSYHPNSSPVIVRVERDEDYLALLTEYLIEMLDYMDDEIKSSIEGRITFKIMVQPHQLKI